MIDRSALVELRLLIEEICCDLCRFESTGALRARPELVRVRREFPLENPEAFADIRIEPYEGPAFFIEVKFGYSDDGVLESLRRKFLKPLPAGAEADRVVLVIDRERRANFEGLIAKAEALLAPGLRLEVWDEDQLRAMLHSHFQVEVSQIVPERLLDVRAAVDRAKGWHAFGGESLETYVHDALKAQLMWNFGFWRMRQYREASGCQVGDILKPGVHDNVAVIIADLCSFSSFVRDTPDADVMRSSLIAFYSKARYEIINAGGMHYQFVGDEIIGFFGVPDQPEDFIRTAYKTARALCAMGKSVAQQWQRRIDRVQERIGIHVGLSLGTLHGLPLRPFSRTHHGFIGDCINVAARLMGEASADEIVASNGFFQQLGEKEQAEFEPSESVDAKNVGRIKAWRAKVK